MTGGIIPKGFNTIIPIEKIIFHPNKMRPKNILINRKLKKINMCDLKVQITKKKIY